MAVIDRSRRVSGMRHRAGYGGRSIVGGREMTGMPVLDSHGERIGNLFDTVFDLYTGRIAYGVVTLDRAPYWSERVIVIPWNAMHLDGEAGHLCVNALRDWIERAPSMRADTMPSLLDHDHAVLIHSFFGTRPYWEAGSQQHS